MKPLTVYTVLPPKHNASFYYRIGVVLETAAALGLPIRATIDENDANTPVGDRLRTFCEADLVLLYQPVGEHMINNVRGIQSFLPSKRDGEWKWPPTVVVETDDNLFNVSPLNQAFRSLGTRDMNGTLIPLGHHIGVVEGGEKRVLYYDTPLPDGQQAPAGAMPISLARNRQTIESWRKLLSLADQVQCSTPEVEASVKRETTPRRSRVFPNLVRFDHYPQVSIQQEPDKLKILWQGGIAHYEDWYPLKDALGRITERYPHVHWIIWGAQYPWVNQLIPPHRYTFHDWRAYQEYKLRLAMMDHDISLAPLSDNVFNRCRSAIKWYEASVLKKPAATLAQRTGPYLAEIEEGQTGLLFSDPEEFEAKLSTLIEDATLRRTLAANAKDWVSENRDAMKHVPKIVESWEMLREERRLEQPHVSDAQWDEIVAEEEAREREESEGLDGAVPAVNQGG